MSSLLLLEDDNSLGQTLKERLEKENYQVQWAKSCREALASLQSSEFDLVILDVNLPDGSGFDVANKIRKEKTVPFLFMTALNSAENRLKGFEMGAEEFIPKPFHLKELLLRVRHVLEIHRRTEKIICRGVIIDLKARDLTLPDGKKVAISTKDFQVLELLIRAEPEAVSRDTILNSVWGEDKFPTHRTVDNSIVRLRQLLSDDSSEIIRTVRGVGYQWIHQ